MPIYFLRAYPIVAPRVYVYAVYYATGRIRECQSILFHRVQSWVLRSNPVLERDYNLLLSGKYFRPWLRWRLEKSVRSCDTVWRNGFMCIKMKYSLLCQKARCCSVYIGITVAVFVLANYLSGVTRCLAHTRVLHKAAFLQRVCVRVCVPELLGML